MRVHPVAVPSPSSGSVGQAPGKLASNTDRTTAARNRASAAAELLPELAVIAKERPDALFLYPDVVLNAYPRPQQLADFALKALLPTMH